jgi:hypothetical protein
MYLMDCSHWRCTKRKGNYEYNNWGPDVAEEQQKQHRQRYREWPASVALLANHPSQVNAELSEKQTETLIPGENIVKTFFLQPLSQIEHRILSHMLTT